MNQKQPHIVDVIFVLALLGLFALSSLFLITAGSEIYQNTMDNMSTNYEMRTSTTYLSEKARQARNIELTTLKDVTAIAITEDINDVTYVTYLYYYDGYMRELYTEADKDLGSSMLAAGQKICELNSIRFETENNGLIRTTLIYKDNTYASLLLSSY